MLSKIDQCSITEIFSYLLRFLLKLIRRLFLLSFLFSVGPVVVSFPREIPPKGDIGGFAESFIPNGRAAVFSNEPVLSLFEALTPPSKVNGSFRRSLSAPPNELRRGDNIGVSNSKPNCL